MKRGTKLGLSLSRHWFTRRSVAVFEVERELQAKRYKECLVECLKSSESRVLTIRNKEGGHGQGPELSTVPEHCASYTLHLTASNLLV